MSSERRASERNPATLRAIWAGQELTRSQALSMAYAYVSLGTSPASVQEGQKAFASKKRPPWKLR